MRFRQELLDAATLMYENNEYNPERNYENPIGTWAPKCPNKTSPHGFQQG